MSKPVDVASANGKFFLNMATGGFGTEAAKQTDSDLKDRVGGAAYLITGEQLQVLLSASLLLQHMLSSAERCMDRPCFPLWLTATR